MQGARSTILLRGLIWSAEGWAGKTYRLRRSIPCRSTLQLASAGKVGKPAGVPTAPSGFVPYVPWARGVSSSARGGWARYPRLTALALSWGSSWAIWILEKASANTRPRAVLGNANVLSQILSSWYSTVPAESDLFFSGVNPYRICSTVCMYNMHIVVISFWILFATDIKNDGRITKSNESNSDLCTVCTYIVHIHTIMHV